MREFIKDALAGMLVGVLLLIVFLFIMSIGKELPTNAEICISITHTEAGLKECMKEIEGK